MNTCEEHDEAVVVYTRRRCPVCVCEKDTKDVRASYDSEVNILKEEVLALQNLLSDVEDLSPEVYALAVLKQE
jgi:antirestriction protein